MAETQIRWNPSLIKETDPALDVSFLDWSTAPVPGETLGVVENTNTCELSSSPGGAAPSMVESVVAALYRI